MESRAYMRKPGSGDLKSVASIVRVRNLPLGDADTGGEDVVLARVRVKIEPVGWGTYTAGVQTGEVITHRAFIRHRAGISQSDELREHGGPTYRIRRSQPLGGGREWLVLELEELRDGEGYY